MLRKDLKMAGRHLCRPPSHRAVGEARYPSLPVVKELLLPPHHHHHHHHHHQQDHSSRILKSPSFFGLWMMGRELKAAERHIGSPSCGNIATKQSAAPVKEANNGHVTGSGGGGSPSAGAQSPSDSGGSPSAGALSPGDGTGSPSSGPDYWSDPIRHQQQPTSFEEKITAFLGVGLLQIQRKVARRYFSLLSSYLVVKEADGGVHQVACDGGGSPLAGLPLPVPRPDPSPSRHQQRQPLFLGLLPSPPHHCSAPATCPRCRSGAAGNALLAGGSFASAGARNASPAKLKVPPSRFYSTIPPPVQAKVDLLKVDKIWAAGDKSLSNIELAAEKIGASPPIQRIDPNDLLASISLDKEACKSYQDKEKALEFYQNKLRPALVARGLVSPFPPCSKQGIQLHKEFHRLTLFYPKYITSLELAMEMTTMHENLWAPCFDCLSEQRCMVIEDWDKPLDMSIGVFLFDHTVAFDGSDVYRGESDASYFAPKKKPAADASEEKEPGIAMACCAVWNHKNERLTTILVKDFSCDTSNVAEVIAMVMLLKEGKRLGLHKSFFQPCSDSSLVYQLLSGILYIDPNADSETTKLYRLLKYMRNYFDKLLPRWENREKMLFVDGLMREAKRQEMLGSEEFLDMRSLVRKTAYYLSGNPVFKLYQKSNSISRITKKKSSPLDLEFQDSYYVEVDEEHKIDALWHITSALRPARVHVMIVDLKSRTDYAKNIKYLFGQYVRANKEGCSLFTIDVSKMKSPTSWNKNLPNKDLLILFDATIQRQEFQKVLQMEDSFTVFLTTTSERGLISKLNELSPLSFVCFIRVAQHTRKMEVKKGSMKLMCLLDLMMKHKFRCEATKLDDL